MDEFFDICVNEAKIGCSNNEVPVGAVIVKDGVVIASAHNMREESSNVLSHAEINAIILASNILGTWNLSDCELYVTLEPCSMCKEIIKQAKVHNVYYLLCKPDYKKEFYKTNFANVSSYDCKEYADLLSGFFKKKRKK